MNRYQGSHFHACVPIILRRTEFAIPAAESLIKIAPSFACACLDTRSSPDVTRRLFCASLSAMPPGSVAHNFHALTYSHRLHHVPHSTHRPFTASRPKRGLQLRRMAPKAPAAASATNEDGATFPSTAGPGSQRMLRPELAHPNGVVLLDVCTLPLLSTHVICS